MSDINNNVNESFFFNLKSVSTETSIINESFSNNISENRDHIGLILDQEIDELILKPFLKMENHWGLTFGITRYEAIDNPLPLSQIYLSGNNIIQEILNVKDAADDRMFEITTLSPSLDGVNFGKGIKRNHIGSQKQLISKSLFQNINDTYHQYLSLGDLRADFKEVEVILRNTEILEFNINTIRKDQNLQNPKAPLCGLTIQEACMVMKYAGASSRLKKINIFGFSDEPKYQKGQAEILGHLIWYFADGIQFRSEKSSKNKFEYFINTELSDLTFKFIEDRDSGKWFVNFPEMESEVFSCNEKDYQLAKNNKISPRIMRLISEN